VAVPVTAPDTTGASFRAVIVIDSVAVEVAPNASVTVGRGHDLLLPPREVS
jgi:hypothetical protein